jgi:SPASM domain peptide maturase of grasp-with-spasm system
MIKYKKTDYIILFATLKFVKGFRHAAIYDTAREKLTMIPNSLYDFCVENNKKSIFNIISRYKNQAEITLEYLDFLFENEYAFIASRHDIKHFSEMSYEWDYYSHITNVIIEHSFFTYSYLSKIIKQINVINSIAIEYISSVYISIDDLDNVARLFLKADFHKYLKIQIPYHSSYTIEAMSVFLERHKYIQSLIVFSSPFSHIQEQDNSLYFMQQPLCSQDCGIVNKEYFSLNLRFLTEAQAHNTCLNRKLCIDAEGNIKNCPAMSRSFGNIKDTTLQEVIEKEEFQDLWFINKDKIDVCKDCEFRYMCMDCRCFIKDLKNIYSQPAKCGYNPYICKWAGQEGYIPVEECGTYNRKTGFVPDTAKIEEFNRQIWGEEDE